MKDDPSSEEHDATPQDGSREPATRQLEPLPTSVRIVFFLLGSVLVLIGLVALALPVVPQAIPLAAGAALLSLASDKVYLALRIRLRRWPWIWKPVRALRRRVHAVFSGRHEATQNRSSSDPDGAEGVEQKHDPNPPIERDQLDDRD